MNQYEKNMQRVYDIQNGNPETLESTALVPAVERLKEAGIDLCVVDGKLVGRTNRYAKSICNFLERNDLVAVNSQEDEFISVENAMFCDSPANSI